MRCRTAKDSQLHRHGLEKYSESTALKIIEFSCVWHTTIQTWRFTRDLANRMMGNVVYVCLDETHESCKECGTFVEPVGKKEWGKMTCGDRGGIKGRYVKVAATSSYLQITEIEIYGRGKSKSLNELPPTHFS